MKALPFIEELLHSRLGFDLRALGGKTVPAAVDRRMVALGLDAISDYGDRIASSDEEFLLLAEEIVVPETWFFRDAAPFEYLRDWVREVWLSRSGHGRFRALSAGCSTGEEAYSIAAVLLEAGIPAERVSVLGVDISDRALEKARKGQYRPRLWRPRFDERYRQHIKEKDGGIEVGNEIRSCVRFEQVNLIEPLRPAVEGPFDVVFCRNLVIYQTEGMRSRMLAALGELLREDGLLFVGHAEPLRVSEAGFRRIGPAKAFAFTKGAETAAEPLKQVQPSLARPASPRSPIGWGPATSGGEMTVADLLSEARRQADAGLLSEAAELCRRVLRMDEASAEAFYLLGSVAQAEGHADDAQAYHEKAVYLDHGHQEALRQLALLAEGRGDNRNAGLYRRRARRVFAARSGE